MKSIFAAAVTGGLLLLAGADPGARGPGGVGSGPLAHAPSEAGQGATAPSRGEHAGAPGAATLTEVVDQYCVRCHSERRMTGNLSLESFAVEDAAAQAEVAEKVIRKPRADMMPAPGANRPAGDTRVTLVETLETTIDEA